jgi:hypothetical protein
MNEEEVALILVDEDKVLVKRGVGFRYVLIPYLLRNNSPGTGRSLLFA